MYGFVLKRLALAAPVMLGIATIVFLLMFAIPGDPVRLLMGQHGDPETEAQIRVELGLDKPILATGGGGYNLDNTVRAWALAWSILAGCENGHIANLGVGGVMLESTDWQGGLRDRTLAISEQQRKMVFPAVEKVIEKVKENVFKIHGLK